MKIVPSTGEKHAIGPCAERTTAEVNSAPDMTTLMGGKLPFESITESNSVWYPVLLSEIWHVPLLTTLKVKVARTPLPDAPVLASVISLREGRSPSVLLAGTGTNMVLPAALRNGPSVGELDICNTEGSQDTLTVHPPRFVTLLI